MKRFILGIGIGLVLLVVVALVAVFFSLNSIVKKGVETIGPQLTKVEMRLGAAKLSPLSGNGQLTDLFIGNPEGYKTPSAIKVGEIKVGLRLSSLRSDTMVVEEVNFQSPEITLEGGLDGNNLSRILDNLEAAAGGGNQSGKTKAPAGKEKKFQVKEVVVQSGKIHLSVTALGGQALTVPLPELRLQNIGTAGHGVSAAELSRQILKPLLASITKAASEAVKNAGQDILGKETTEQINKASKGVKDLFKKKPSQP